MATPVFTIVPNPHWVIIDNFSKLPDGAAIYTYRSLDPSTFKPAFQDSAGSIPYGQPIVGFGNGTMPPIFWEFDPNNPTDTYYIRVYDSADPTTQQFLWDFNGLSGSIGSGGGTIVTAYNIENLVINNTFYRNIGNQAGTPSLPAFLTLAPSNFAGFVGNSTNINGSPSPDIIFSKNNTTASDNLSFLPFTPLGINDLAPDITPEIYLRYLCTNPGAGETYKYIQYPISKGVQNLSQQLVTVKIYGRCNSGDTTLELKWRQFYGDGGAPSPDQIVAVGASLTLTNVWKQFLIPSQVPDATGKTLGSCGNDGLFLQVCYPLNALTSMDFIKPAVYLGQIAAPGADYVTNDEIDSIVNSPRTGDIRFSLNDYLFGYVPMNDGTIGDPSSNATTRKNIDTFPLFNLIWSLFVTNQALAPMLTSGSVPVAYGASAILDFTANNQLTLTKAAGRVLAAVSGAHLIGTSLGTETHTLISSELPDPLTTGAHSQSAAAGPNFFAIDNNAAPGISTISNAGGNVPFSIMQPTVYYNIFVKL